MSIPGAVIDLSGFNLRVDSKTKEASVNDVIMFVTKQPKSQHKKIFSRLDETLQAKCHKMQINGKEQATLVTSAPVLIQIIWELPGKAAKEFRRECANYICRVMGGDLSLVHEMELRAIHTPEVKKEFFMKDAKVPNLPIPTAEQKEEIKEKRNIYESCMSAGEEEGNQGSTKKRKTTQEIGYSRVQQLGQLVDISKNIQTLNDPDLKQAFKEATLAELRLKSQEVKWIENNYNELKKAEAIPIEGKETTKKTKRVKKDRITEFMNHMLVMRYKTAAMMILEGIRDDPEDKEKFTDDDVAFLTKIMNEASDILYNLRFHVLTEISAKIGRASILTHLELFNHFQDWHKSRYRTKSRIQESTFATRLEDILQVGGVSGTMFDLDKPIQEVNSFSKEDRARFQELINK